ncbi:MAG TPA: glutathione transferase GstA [Kofleriaceae bacterium]|nr:glutathione transferase GstA [Kofleriaceae bacterium]
MKLYYSTGACSLSPNIVAHELGLPVELVKVADKKTADGRDFWQINPKGYVPVLELDSGEILTEGPTIVQYLADQKPDAGLVPPAGTMARYRVQEMLGFINSEIHKSYSPLFSATTPAETRAERLEYLRKRYRTIEAALDGKSYLFGDAFTVADAYLFTVTNWARFVKLDLSDFPNLQAFQARVAARAGVQAAMAAEGLIKKA